MRKIICTIFGHSYLYNFPVTSQPNRAICKRCRQKEELNLPTMEWRKVDAFVFSNKLIAVRTDDELIAKWHPAT